MSFRAEYTPYNIKKVNQVEVDCMEIAITVAVNHPEFDYLWLRGYAYDTCMEATNQC